jgi:Na+-driven multidrug efflux pump
MNTQSNDPMRDNVFISGRLPVIFARTAAPIIMITTINGLFAVVDAYFLGAYVGPAALSAVSLIFPGLMLLIALQSLVANGMASILARRLGAGDRDGARQIFAAAHALALIVVALLNTVYWSAGRGIIERAAAGDADVASGAILFMGVTVAFAPISFFLSLHLDALRCEGKIGLMTLITLAASLLNIFANWLLMAVFHWGVLGSVAGTIAAQALCLLAVLGHRLRRPTALRLIASFAVSDWREIVALGAPMSLGFIGICLCSAAILFNLSIWNTGDRTATVAAYGIITRVMTFAYLPLLGLGIALQTIAGHNHGAGLPERVGRSLRIALITALLYGAAVELAVELLAGRLGAVFVDFQSIGDAGRAAIFGLARPYLLTLPLTFLLPSLFGEQGIWMVPVVAEAGMFLIALVLSAKRRGSFWYAHRRCVVEFPLPYPLRAGHDVEIVEIVAVAGGAGVVALRHQRHVAVLQHHRLVERAVVGVDALEAEALRRVEAVVIGLLEEAFVRQVVLIMLVRRIDEVWPPGVMTSTTSSECRRRIVLGHDVVDVADIGALAARQWPDACPAGSPSPHRSRRPAPSRRRVRDRSPP